MNLKNVFAAQIFPRFSYPAIKNQILKIWPTTVLGIIVSLGGAGITVFVANLTGNPIWKLAKDPAEVMRFPPYIGMLSNWSGMLWIAAAAICLFSAIILKQQNAAGATVMFIAVSGGFSLFLGIDDLFRLHDHVLPKLFHIRERIFYALYLVVILAYLLYFLPKILEYDYLLLGAAFFLFGLSRRVFITLPYFDQFMTTGDVLKYFGIVSWLAFFYRAALLEVGTVIKAGNKSA